MTVPTDAADITAIVDHVRAGFDQDVTRPIAWREAQLDGLVDFLHQHGSALIDAMVADLGRPALEAYGTDIGSTAAEVRHLRKNLARWAEPRPARLSLTTLPGRGRVIPEPLGVALIMAPWNYPVRLVVEPVAAALAAGNAVVAKPSELAPATSAVLAETLPSHLDTTAFAVVEGDADVGTSLLAEPFDHIFFTGSVRVGRTVMQAAAEHLTPVTLELGGKSPCIVDDTVDLDVAAHRITWGKWLNAGQTCIAPDYLLVTEACRDELVSKIGAVLEEFYGPDPRASEDFARIANDTHFDRLVQLLHGQRVVVGGDHLRDDRYLAPTLVLDPPHDSALMTEEIFGPILPVVTVSDVDDAITFVTARPKPLALYMFSENPEAIGTVVERTSSGSVCVNHTLLQFTASELPFGGVGASGTGRYHGKAGFETFSNMKSVLHKPTRAESSLLYPPYRKWQAALIRRILR